MTDPRVPEAGTPCEACYGEGYVKVWHPITREMAMDAGEPSWEGQGMPERVTCEACGGAGVVGAGTDWRELLRTEHWKRGGGENMGVPPGSFKSCIFGVGCSVCVALRAPDDSSDDGCEHNHVRFNQHRGYVCVDCGEDRPRPLSRDALVRRLQHVYMACDDGKGALCDRCDALRQYDRQAAVEPSGEPEWKRCVCGELFGPVDLYPWMYEGTKHRLDGPCHRIEYLAVHETGTPLDDPHAPWKERFPGGVVTITDRTGDTEGLVRQLHGRAVRVMYRNDEGNYVEWSPDDVGGE